jgi:propanol-preferring alcohol dehydrogenase
MHAMVLGAPKPVDALPLELKELPTPVPGAREILVRVEVCGVCRTDLRVVEGDLPPRRTTITPGHQVVGRVVAFGPGSRERFPSNHRPKHSRSIDPTKRSGA